jgi:hypothetical protein
MHHDNEEELTLPNPSLNFGIDEYYQEYKAYLEYLKSGGLPEREEKE